MEDLNEAPVGEKTSVESSKISLKAPGARGPGEEAASHEISPALEPVLQPAQPEESRVIKPAASQDLPKARTTVPLRKETMRVSLKAPSAHAQPPAHAEPVAPESPVGPSAGQTSTPPARPEEQEFQPREEKAVPVRKETIRVSLKAPVAQENDPMENPDLLEPRKLSERTKEDPNQKYAPPGLQHAHSAGLDQILEPSQMLEPEPEPEPEPEQMPMSLDQPLPLRKETMRVSVRAPFAGMAAAQAAAAREPILATQAAKPEPEPAPAVYLEQSTAAVSVVSPNAVPPPPRQKVQQASSALDTPLVPVPLKPKRDLGSILMTWVCILLGIIAAVMIYLVFTT